MKAIRQTIFQCPAGEIDSAINFQLVTDAARVHLYVP
jgi:hypothetical protein